MVAMMILINEMIMEKIKAHWNFKQENYIFILDKIYC